MGEGPTDDAFTFDLLAASIRADAADVRTFLEVLATKLEDALPGQVTVHRAGGLLRRRRPVQALAISLGSRRYEMRQRGDAVGAQVAHRARGITLRTEEWPVDAWIEALSRDLAEHARASAEARAALARLIG